VSIFRKVNLILYFLFPFRTCLHAGWDNDNTQCTAYLLRHLRKILLLIAVPYNAEAVRALMHLATLPSPPPPNDRLRRLRHKFSADELRRQHEEQHGNVGLMVQLTLEDLERLHLVLQPPSGGGIEDPPLRIGDFIFKSLFQILPPPMASIPIADVEREIRRHLELELLMSDVDNDKDDASTDEDEAATNALAKLSLSDTKPSANESGERAEQPRNQYLKELSYNHLRCTTILLKPNPTDAGSAASSASGGANLSHVSPAGRLHDLAINDCSDAHFYLLQPFEHATISGCTGCTIIVGAVAGLLHVIDCEKTQITTASRRVLVSNSSDVQMCMFSPSSPLLVGDNRSCQFAPYNTYYDGLREDLLATGLAAAVLPENQSPYHGVRNLDNEAAWPPVHCASNKWKQPIDISKLEMPQIPNAAGLPSPPSSPSNTQSPKADDKAMGVNNDTPLHSPVLLPASEFHIIFVPLESDAARQRRIESEENEAPDRETPPESQYCQTLAEVIQLSPFRLPSEYERRVLIKAERMRNIQQAVKKNLTEEQQKRFEEELNRGFRDWLVTSGNLRQVLDLVHLERRGGV
jgi:hypothetical protein